MNLKDILSLIDKVADRELGVFEIESSGLKLRIEAKKEEPRVYASEHPAGQQAHVAHQPSAGVESAPQPAGEEEIDPTWHIVTSPIVGTFYRSPSPESEPFVTVGHSITKGSVICIVEAMKLMNEIEADVSGTVMKIFPQNAQPVEYGERLFAVRV